MTNNEESTYCLKTNKLIKALNESTVDLKVLKDLLWSGIPEDAPSHLRRDAWQLILGFLPTKKQNREASVSRKTIEYEELKNNLFYCSSLSESEEKLLRQIRVDLPRTHTGIDSLKCQLIRDLMERVLFIWSVRHPASGYVQGINDLVCPFIIVFLLPKCNCETYDSLDLHVISEDTLLAVEVEVYWCLTKFLASIQDHYVNGQPGIHKMINYLSDIVRRSDPTLYDHIGSQNVDFLQFSFRWMNCLLTRELSTSCLLRLWDSYVAENVVDYDHSHLQSFSRNSITYEQSLGNNHVSLTVADNHMWSSFIVLHIYVCASIILHFSNDLIKMDFQRMILFLQKLPSDNWKASDIELLLAQAFVLRSLYHSSQRHLHH